MPARGFFFQGCGLMRRLGRPAGIYGEIGQALVKAAAQGPGTARQLAERSCVGYDAARYTASRLGSTGALARLSNERPALLGLPAPACDDAAELADQADLLARCFWRAGPPAGQFADI